ncbi:hypothetical protein [Flavobacterium sp.]
MKKIKILVLLFAISTAFFYSCSDNNPVENEAITTKSISLRTTLNEIKKATNIAGKTTTEMQDQALCFNFVYPITLSYNNGTQISVANFQGLMEILTNETDNLYIEGIAYPFQVQAEGTVTTINNEREFFAHIQTCGNFLTVNDFLFDFTCYSIIYPISVINANNQTITVNNQAELMRLISTPTGIPDYQLNIVFPITVTQNNLSIVINDLYEFFELNNNCDNDSGCICPENYEPVCVLTTNGVVEYPNACFAECDGYTQNDFVNCNTSCICPTDFNPVCVQTTNGIVQYSNACNAECAGFTSADFVSCGSNPNQNFGQLLGSCFVINYPVQIQSQGALVTINNNSECLQYWYPSQSAYPAFNYPITVTFFGGAFETVTSQAAFQSLVSQHCN